VLLVVGTKLSVDKRLVVGWRWLSVVLGWSALPSSWVWCESFRVFRVMTWYVSAWLVVGWEARVLGCFLLVGLSLLLLALVKLSVLILAALPFPCRCLWVLVGRSGSRCVVGWNGGQGNSCAVFLGWLLVLDCTVLGC